MSAKKRDEAKIIAQQVTDIASLIKRIYKRGTKKKRGKRRENPAQRGNKRFPILNIKDPARNAYTYYGRSAVETPAKLVRFFSRSSRW